MHEQIVADAYNGILFGYKKEWSTDTGYNMNEPQKQSKWQKPNTMGYCMILFIWTIHTG